MSAGPIVLVATSPKAGPRSGQPSIERLRTALHERGLESSASPDVPALAAEARTLLRQGRLQAVVAAGGDGTVALVANHLPPEAPIAILPLGTENLLARQLGCPRDPVQVAELIQTGAARGWDAGLANDRLFLLMVGCGFDAEVVRRLHRQRTGHIGHLSYLLPIWQAIRSYRYPEVRVYCDAAADAEPTFRARWAFVVNQPRYAGGLQFAPNAQGDDGLLDVCTFAQGSLWYGLSYLWGVWRQRHPTWRDCQMRTAVRVRLEADQPVPYQLDGDPGGELPVDIRILPDRVRLLAPGGGQAD